MHAVEDVSLALPAGGITAIVGESGSGKSTLAKLLARLIRPTAGHLLLDGQDIPASSRVRRGYARQVQLVLQDPFASLNPIHDVRYHLTRPLKVHGLDGWSDLDQAVAGLLERVALSPAEQFTGKYPHELSGGQRQRVAIARALAVAPRILLADEPVSMLDVSIRLGVLNLLADLRERDGLAIVVRHPRHRLGQVPGRRHRGDVRGPDHRVRTGHVDHRPASSSVHPAAAQRGARSRPGAGTVAARPRRAAEPGDTAARLPVPPALPARHADLRRGRAGHDRRRRRARQRLLAARAGPEHSAARPTASAARPAQRAPSHRAEPPPPESPDQAPQPGKEP